LISEKLHPQIAVLASFNGTILSKDEAAYQIMGLKTYRRWSLDDSSDNLKYFSNVLAMKYTLTHKSSQKQWRL
jgi:translation elongation factor P/translation initiation factor 5A